MYLTSLYTNVIVVKSDLRIIYKFCLNIYIYYKYDFCVIISSLLEILFFAYTHNFFFLQRVIEVFQIFKTTNVTII